MLKKTLAAVVLAVIVAAFSAPAWAADGDGATGTVSAAVGSSSGIFGTRSVTSVAITPLAIVPGTASMNGVATIVVTELARTGTAEWSVRAILDEIGTAGSGNGLTDGLVSPTYVPRSALNVAAATPTIVPGPPATGVLGAGGALSIIRTLYTVNTESTSLNYTNTYTSLHTLTLTIPNAQKTGVYTGTLRISLVQ